MEKHVVIIYPHPDDESFGTAGSIINFRKKGIPVTYLCGTLGEMGRNMGSPFFANRETLPRIREKELEKVAEYLDIDVELLGYRDKTLEYENQEKMANHIKEILERIKPSLVITHYPGYAVHPDHDALGAAVIKAVELMDSSERPIVWVQAIIKGYQEIFGTPDVINDVSDIFEKKMEAILIHKSQAGGMLGSMNQESKLSKTGTHDLKQKLEKEQFYIWKF